MLRRLFSGVFEAVVQPPETTVCTNPFTRPETSIFAWLTSVAPCFPINSNRLRILIEPHEFYKILRDGCATAQKRIILVSLYLGNGNLERQLIETLINNNNFRNGGLDVRVLLDYTRGSRGDVNSRTMLQPLLRINENCEVSLYHTPKLRGVVKKLTPNRWNELLGLQHMKLYIFDDTLVISGANLSNDYFTNRQDRYFVINDRKLCDFYAGLVRNVQKFSLKMTSNNQITLADDWQQSPYEGDHNNFVEKAKELIEDYLEETKSQQQQIRHENDYDTWIFPLVQMGQFRIRQDSQVTQRLLAESPIGANLKIATGYFNLTQQYMETLIDCRARCEILMAHPECNGFYGARGVAGGIPAAYSLIAHKFQQQFTKSAQNERIKLFEYLRNKWTYHSKGLWYYPPGAQYPCLTLIGSPNFGERSVHRDLETQVAIVTENEALRQRFDTEYRQLFRFALPADVQRPVPRWVHLFVAVFRNYF